MSKMSQLHAALTAQAAELGFENIRQAEEAGFVVDYDTCSLVKEGWSAQDQAHEAWLKEKDEILHLIDSVKEDIVELNDGDNSHVAIDNLDTVIDFIEGVRHE